jgi:hypothetical protein
MVTQLHASLVREERRPDYSEPSGDSHAHKTLPSQAASGVPRVETRTLMPAGSRQH